MQPATSTLDATVRHRQNWPPWIVVSLFTVIFAILCFVSGRRMENYTNDFDDVSESVFRPVVITSIFTGVVVSVFIVLSFFITWGRSVNEYASRSLDAVFAACLLYMFLLTLLCAVSMHGFRRFLEYRRDEENYAYKDSDYGVFVMTFAAGYLCAIFYLLYMLLLAWSALVFTQTPNPGVRSVNAWELEMGTPAAP